MTTTKCIACHRKALPGNKYCLHHKQAFDSMINHYKGWVNAYGMISWEEFLTKLLDMQETGSWIKEVIELELKK
ncbi:MAG TPA: hypothetical protein VE692_00175 [Nitrososphaera sp.]|nr:hypothetical protein [Nitrososphaera sp.]